jgi:competence protein ComEC
MKLITFRNILIFVTCITAFTSIYLLTQSHKQKTLQIVFLDVGQGDAMLITTPNHRQIIIDTGPQNNLGQKLASHMSASDRSLDLVIMTHPDLDHVGGMLSLLDRYSIETIIHSGLRAGAPIYSAIAEKIQEQKIPTITGESGQVIQLDKHVFLEIHAPSPGRDSLDANDYSIVSRLVYGDTSIMLTGDVGKIIEYELVDSYAELLDSDILKLGHHGSQTSTSEQFVQTVSPEYGIISAGCDNRFGHPHAGVLATLHKNKVEIISTCDEGDIVFESDGEGWVRG